ncbi:MG2 domain-containing protein [Blastopirellula retiformator]|uniref:MG2 domain protein n=1 Tax=Blastopirellula retiformator TaxID=2527970 RepID=A0A5C5VL34_9BACT|nr:MG2 domain-containing protein [Blastopirellula retiformator]TWT38630.1 MG2 domain protein [Blastopirellula retiformator]
MTDHDENRQQLLELIYGLLSDDEASQLATRIGRDPELARAYAEIKEQTDLLAAAVRFPGAAKPDFAAWKKQAKEENRAERLRSADGFVRTMQALTALAAAVLILASAAAVVLNQRGDMARSNTPAATEMAATEMGAFDDADMAMASLRSSAIELEVSGPRVLNSEVSNRFVVSVSNEARVSDPAEISYNFKSPQGETFAAGKQLANNGLAKIELPAAQAMAGAKLQVEARQGRQWAEVESPELAAAPPATVTSLAVDRPLVRAGDTIRWRSNTLTSQTQQPIDGLVAFEILDPQQQRVAGYVDQGQSRQGIAASDWKLPLDAVAGNYSLIAKNADGVADVTRFQVDPLAPPVWNARLDFAQDFFTPGQPIAASLQMQTQTGQPLANQKLQMRQIVDGRLIAEPQEIETSPTGEANVELQLAASAAPSATHHLFFSNADQSWAFAAPIPLQPYSIDVNFYPEGGALVAGLSNRVFFHAADFSGKPVELKGAIVNSRDEVVARAETEYRGRGQFDFIPLPEQDYRLSAAVGESQVMADLPAASTTDLATLKVSDAVVNSDEPLEVEVVSRDADQRYGLAYYNNGALVTQQFFAVPQTLKPTRVRLDVPAEIAGAGEVTLYAADDQGQVKPLAERMVFRRPQRQLAIEADELQTEYAAGDRVNLQVAAKDEAGQPAAAALGVAIVNENAFAHTTQQSPTLVASQLLTKRLQRPEELQDPQALLQDDAEAEKQLDYILATDGWRQFVKAGDQNLYAQNRQAVPPAELSAMSSMFTESIDESLVESPILVLKNKIAASPAKLSKNAPTKVAAQSASSGVSLTPWIFAAAIATTAGLIVLALLGSAGPAWFWGPAVTLTSVATVAIAWLSLASMQPPPTSISAQVALKNSAEAPIPTPMADREMAAELEQDELFLDAAGGEKRSAVAGANDRVGEAETEEMRMDSYAASPPITAQPMMEEAKEAESRPLEKSERRLNNMAAPMMAPAEATPAPASPELAPGRSVGPKSAAAETPKAEANLAEMPATAPPAIASDAPEAKTQVRSAPASGRAGGSPSFKSMPAPYSANDAIPPSDYAGSAQSRFSMADKKADTPTLRRNRQAGDIASSEVEQELLMRNQAIGTAEYGLRKAASQQMGLSQQAQQVEGLTDGFGGDMQQAPNLPLPAANGPGGQPRQRMMLSRGAALQDQVESDDAQPSATGAAAQQRQEKDFYYRAYAYGDDEKRDLDGLLGAQPTPETIFWAPLVQTDDNGQATLSFQLPPTPGKYRITIDAVGDGRIGSVRKSFNSRPVSESATPPPAKKAGK